MIWEKIGVMYNQSEGAGIPIHMKLAIAVHLL